MIRDATPEDRPAVLRLQSLLPESTPCLLDGVGTVVVSVDETDTPVGYLLAVVADGAHVAELVVDPDHRREGRASDLLSTLLANVDGRVTVATTPDNYAALSLYRSLGFEVLEERPDYYESAPALLLARDPENES